MLSRRPYLIRAIYDWVVDSGCTPYLLADTGTTGMQVPAGYEQDGKIILDISAAATSQLKLGNDTVSFSARFGGVAQQVIVPVAAVMAVYAQETGQGMLFGTEDLLPPTPPGNGTDGDKVSPAAGDGATGKQKKTKLKVVK